MVCGPGIDGCRGILLDCAGKLRLNPARLLGAGSGIGTCLIGGGSSLTAGNVRGTEIGGAMTITSTNHNPGNESKYARHRRIWKGRHNKLAETMARLQATRDITTTTFDNTGEFNGFWGCRFSIKREPPTKRSQILGRWQIDPPSEKMLAVLSTKLRADLSLLWDDFVTVVARRIGRSDGVGISRNTEPFTGRSLLVFAYGAHSFDLIASKYGMGDNLGRNHYFYQWQARTRGFDGLVNVDDYEGEEGLTFYLAS
jgi:hypothetical protein